MSKVWFIGGTRVIGYDTAEQALARYTQAYGADDNLPTPVEVEATPMEKSMIEVEKRLKGNAIGTC